MNRTPWTNLNGIDVLEHGGLIRHAIKTLPASYRRLLPEDDLMQVGWLALMRAAELYDPSRGFKWSTYAIVSVRRRIVHEAMNQAGVVRVPASQGGQGDTGAWFEAAARARASRLKPSSRDGFDSEYSPGNEPPSGDDTAADAVRNVTAEAVRDGLKYLVGRQRVVIRMRYFEHLTLREIGRRLGVSREMVRQVEEQALARLRVWLRGRV